jgi:hypothetical protein
MKKIFLLIGIMLLAGCIGGGVERKPETKGLTQLRDEPVGCQFLYRLEVDTLVYSRDDAIAYMENRIIDQARRGNAYWIVSLRTNHREWRLFGQDRSYIITANVYRCPDHAPIVTKGDIKQSGDYHWNDWGA